MVMPGWYDIDFGRARDDTAGILQVSFATTLFIEFKLILWQSTKILENILDQEVKQIPSTNIVVGGFSQGGAMAIFTGYGTHVMKWRKPHDGSSCRLRRPQRLAGIVSCSGYVLNTVFDPQLSGIQRSNMGIPILVYHGESDGVVCVQALLAVACALRSH
jgi:predicted esterase